LVFIFLTIIATAAATAMEKPLEMQWSRYRTFWAAQFRDMARIVFAAKNEYGKGGIKNDLVKVSTDYVSGVDIVGTANAMGRVYKDVLLPMMDKGIVDNRAAHVVTEFVLTLFVNALGGSDTSKMLDKEMDLDSVVSDGGEGDENERDTSDTSDTPQTNSTGDEGSEEVYNTTHTLSVLETALENVRSGAIDARVFADYLTEILEEYASG
jgi:hypothetical protein